MKKSIRIISLLLAVITTFTLVSCSKNAASRKRGDDAVVMTVGEHKVTKDLYDYFYNGFMTQYGANSESVESEDELSLLKEKSHEEALASLKKFFAVYTLCSEYGIDPKSETIASAAEIYEEEFIVNNCNGSSDTLHEMLKAQGITYEVFMMLMEHGVLENTLYDELIYQNVIDTEALAGDGENPDFKDNIARVKHVLVKFDATYKNIIYDTTPEKEAAYNTAMNVYTMAIGGTDFDTLVKEYGEDMTMFANKIGAYVFMGNQDKAYEEAAFALAEGEISQPVPTSEGYVVIRRLPLDTDYMKNNFSSLITSCTEGQFNILIEQTAEKFMITEQ